jgi:hypothetical protein
MIRASPTEEDFVMTQQPSLTTVPFFFEEVRTVKIDGEAHFVGENGLATPTQQTPSQPLKGVVKRYPLDPRWRVEISRSRPCRIACPLRRRVGAAGQGNAVVRSGLLVCLAAPDWLISVDYADLW